MGIEESRPGVSLADRAYHVLRDRLIMLDIAPGRPINEVALAADLGIGRTPIREALKRLEVDHLVVSYARRGTFATQVDVTDLAAIFEVRRALEPLAARRAAENPRAGVRAAFASKAQEIATIDRGESFDLMAYDLEVHRMIYRAADNPHLEETLVRLDNLATRIWCLVLDRLPTVPEHILGHVELLEAIAAGDADRAEKLAAAHVTDFDAAIRACF